MPRTLSLTPNHIARVHRVVDDTGPPPGMVLHNDADYAERVATTLATNPAPDRPIRLFAYGSLIWKPEIAHQDEAPGMALGWHRAFCLRQQRFRGTVETPGLMMALDRGGRCKGVLYTLPPEDPAEQLDRLFRREFTVKPITNMPRWITVATESGPVPALAFVINRASANYAGRLTADAVAEVLARACGHWGSGAEYLLNTVTQLEARGMTDAALWRLQRLVAARIDGLAS